jgi:L-alanine-DL-glutamate epimerase-like enolase superfamily enzyme
MIIERIETFPLRIPFRPGAGPAGTAGTVGSLLVKVTTDEGLEGWGEAFGFEAVPVARLAVEELVAPLCAGRDAARIAPLMRDVQRKLHVFGRAGAVMHAVSAVDTALWDIAGKTAGEPLHRLLAGPGASGADGASGAVGASGDGTAATGGDGSLACYASLDPYGAPALVRAGVRRALDAGFRAVKLHEREPAAVRAARDEAGPDVALMVDVNCPWTIDQARSRADELSGARLQWLEEPLWPPEDYAGLARLREQCPIPLAAGENAATLLEFGRLMDGAVDFVQPSPAKMGGVTELCEVFKLAKTRDVTPMPHTFYHGPGLLAAIGVTAALGAADSMIEWRFTDLAAHVYGDALIPVDGRIRVPRGPGLGVDPDPGVIRAYLAA